MHEDEFAELRTTTRNLYCARPLEAVLERRADLAARQEALSAYAHRSAPQDREHDQNAAEIIFLDEIAGEKTTEARRAKIEAITRTAQDEANLERPYGTSGPALVKDARHDRLESPAETLQRMRTDPWREAGGPLGNSLDSSAGLISRCHTALEGMEDGSPGPARRCSRT